MQYHACGSLFMKKQEEQEENRFNSFVIVAKFSLVCLKDVVVSCVMFRVWYASCVVFVWCLVYLSLERKLGEGLFALQCLPFFRNIIQEDDNVGVSFSLRHVLSLMQLLLEYYLWLFCSRSRGCSEVFRPVLVFVLFEWLLDKQKVNIVVWVGIISICWN